MPKASGLACFSPSCLSRHAASMLMQRLFSTGIMKMGPSRFDPDRKVGVFNLDLVATLPAQRSEELRKFQWIIGEWGTTRTPSPLHPFRRPTPMQDKRGSPFGGRHVALSRRA